MPKIKVARKSTFIDMTPMVDLAFLLITFFMLTIQFKPEEMVQVQTPGSTASIEVPPEDVLLISVDKKGHVFIGLRGQSTRKAMLARIARDQNVQFTAEEAKRFELIPEIGVPLKQLKQFLSLSNEEVRNLYSSASFEGISVDTTGLPAGERNDFYKYVRFAREAYVELNAEQIRLMVKADNETPVRVIKLIFEALKQQRANRFNLITSQENVPQEFVGYQPPVQAPAPGAN